MISARRRAISANARFVRRVGEVQILQKAIACGRKQRHTRPSMRRATVVKPPASIPWGGGRRSMFLAGSIDMGTAMNWQARVEDALSDLDVLVLNPRRDDWDASWHQSSSDPSFRAQVDWELDAQERCDIILMYFAPDSSAPVTLLELGLAARGGKLVVCCEDGFWRKGNVEVVAARYGIEMVDSLDLLIARAKQRLRC
jgi:hypothetical protein